MNCNNIAFFPDFWRRPDAKHRLYIRQSGFMIPTSQIFIIAIDKLYQPWPLSQSNERIIFKTLSGSISIFPEDKLHLEKSLEEHCHLHELNTAVQKDR